MKKQQWLFKVFSMINSSTSSTTTTSFNNVRRRRPFCSTTTTNTSSLLFAAPTEVAQPPVSCNKQQQQKKLINILLEKKLPLLIVPYDHVTQQKYVKLPSKNLDGGGFICDGTLGFISLFHDDDDDQLININNNKLKIKTQEEVEVYKVYLPEIAKRRICGSSEGWLFTIHRNGEIQLLNPVTRVIVHLPPLTAIPRVASEFISKCEDTKGRLCYLTYFRDDEPPYYSKYDSHYFREKFIQKAVTNTTTTTSTNPATVVVVIIYACFHGLAFYRTSPSSFTGGGNDGTDDEPAAAKRWIRIPEHDCSYYWEDVTFYQGNFYAVGTGGIVGVVKGLDGPSPFMQLIIEEPEADPDYYYSRKNYLVESPSPSSSSSGGGGDLLMVMRDIDEEEEKIFKHPYRTIGFKVWKLDFNGPSWEEVTDLGEDCALFVGYNHSFSFSASKFPGCRGNCIYFTDNCWQHVMFPNGGHNIGVYNLEDGSFEKLYETSSSQLFMPPPVWYVPN